ncbi:MAG: lysylphosphatidylglycerol synthase domain-containing protein [Sulfolobaceae archaeon]
MDKKYIATFILPLVIIAIYAYIFKLNVFYILTEDPRFLLLFITVYILQNSIDSIKDSLLTQLRIDKTLKARLLGSSIGLVVPGWTGQELARSLVYNKYGLNLSQSLSYSILVGLIDVLAICFGYILFLPLYFNPLEIIFIFTVISNILGWSAALSYFYLQQNKLNKIEQFVFKIIKMEHISTSYLEFKSYLKQGMSKKFIIYVLISFLGFASYSLYFYYIIHNILLSIFVSFLYQVSTLIPIPSAAIVGELALSIFLNPSYVFLTRLNYIVSNLIGFLFFREMSFEELKKWSKEILKR